MKPLPVLIIDDEEIDRYLLKRHLKNIPLNIIDMEFSNGEEALELFKHSERSTELYPDTFPPALIFLDVNMPLIDGFEFLDRFQPLRALDINKNCKVVMISSSDHDSDKQKSFSYDFVAGYLIKGESSEDLLEEQIRSALNLQDST